ncbi:MAG: hypothetical protein AAGF97_10295 [Planctomycetota bacterium]
MSRYNIQPLDSFRLSRCQLPIECHLCGHDNLFDADACRHCYAPISIARAMHDEKKPISPSIVTAIGADGSGKTMLLGMLLDILSRQRERTDVTTCDSSSVALQQEAMAALARGEFPAPTSSEPEHWKWAHCRLRRRSKKQPAEVYFVDVSGRSVIYELAHRGNCPLVGGLFSKSQCFLLTIDAMRVHEGDKDEEFYAMQMLSRILEVRERDAQSERTFKGRRTPTMIPNVALVLTKVDQCEACFDNPREYAKGRLANLVQLLEDSFPKHEFFGVSIVGAQGIRRSSEGRRQFAPLRVEPRGVMEPFRWIVRNTCN